MFIKFCVFSKILRYIPDSMASIGFPHGVCECTQWQVKHQSCSSRKHHNILRKNTLFNEHPVFSFTDTFGLLFLGWEQTKIFCMLITPPYNGNVSIYPKINFTFFNVKERICNKKRIFRLLESLSQTTSLTLNPSYWLNSAHWLSIYHSSFLHI